MFLLTEDAVLLCKHLGKVENTVTQHWVTVEGRPVLVDNNPENRTISRCPNYGATIKPCIKTLKVKEGYSAFVRIDGKRICLDSVTGLTDGTPPGFVEYNVKTPGQSLVAEKP